MLLRFIMSVALIGVPTTSGASPTGGKPSKPLAVEAMQNFGKCVVHTTPQGARAVLAMDYRTENYSKALKRLAKGHDRCAASGRIGFNGILFAGAMAEELLRTEFPKQRLPQVLGTAPQPPLQARGESETMALCTVLKAPADVANLIEQVPGSIEEKQALSKLVPVLTECLAKDQVMQTNPPGLRSVLALAGWRIAQRSTD